MTELMRGFTGQMAGMPFENVAIYLEGVNNSDNGKTLLFTVEPENADLLNGGNVTRFPHYIDASVLEREFNGKDDYEISTEILQSLTESN